MIYLVQWFYNVLLTIIIADISREMRFLLFFKITYHGSIYFFYYFMWNIVKEITCLVLNEMLNAYSWGKYNILIIFYFQNIVIN